MDFNQIIVIMLVVSVFLAVFGKWEWVAISLAVAILLGLATLTNLL